MLHSEKDIRKKQAVKRVRGSATPRQVLGSGMERRSKGLSLPGLGHPSSSILFYFLRLEAFSKNNNKKTN